MSRYSLSLPCPFCRAQPDEPCTLPSGKNRREGNHGVRMTALRHAYRSREMVFRLKEDDERFKLAAGDELVCIRYPLDAKVAVLYRLSDGFDPQCNQYKSDVVWLRWHEPAAAAHNQA